MVIVSMSASYTPHVGRINHSRFAFKQRMRGIMPNITHLSLDLILALSLPKRSKILIRHLVNLALLR